MSTDTLRRAAAKVRELAEAARDESGRDASDFEGYALRKVLGRMPAVAAYIAAMHPAVGLALADWLDDLHERITDTDYDEDHELAAALRDDAEVHRALAVARQLLAGEGE